MGSGEGLEPPFHDDKKSVSSSCRCATIYTSRFFVFIRNVQFSLHLDFQSFPCSPDCNVFDSACTDNSSFRCSSSAYLMQISWIFVLRASFRQVTASIDALRLLLFHAYFSVHQYVKELLLQSFPNLSRCKIVAARTTYFIRSWTYLCTVRDTHETELVRECEPDEIRTRGLSLRRGLLFR